MSFEAGSQVRAKDEGLMQRGFQLLFVLCITASNVDPVLLLLHEET